MDAALRKYLGDGGRERIVREYNLPLNQQRLATCIGERLPHAAQTSQEATGA